MGSSWSAAAADRVRHSPAVAFDSHEGTLIHSGVSECSTRLLGPGNAMPCFRQQTILPIRDYPPKSESLNRDRGDGGCGGGLDLPAPQEPLHNIPTFRIVEHRAHLPPAILCIAIFAPAHIPASVNDGHNGNTHHRSGRNDRAPPSSLPAPNGATVAVLHARRLRTSKLPPNGPDSQQSSATRASTPDHHVTRWNAGVAGASDAQPGLPHGKHCRWYSTRIAACSAAIPTVDPKWIMVL